MTPPPAAADAPALLGRLPGLDARWSRTLTVPDASGTDRRWHLLDNGAEPVVGTMLCVHGNPTWSYLWRRFLSGAPAGWRVVAVDQLGMGWSERLEAPRTLPQRIDDLGRVTEALGITGPVVTVAHDWGGPISLGWALAHRDQLAAVVLANTGVDQPSDVALPRLIQLARSRPLRHAVCVTTPLFVRTTTALSRPPLAPEIRDALSSPYAEAARRQSVDDFVADIPLEADHPSRPALEAVAAGIETLDVPALLLWGPRDPVFSQRFLRDLLQRLPHADVHRYARASHLVTEDAPEAAADAWRWVTDHVGPGAGQPAVAAADDATVPAPPPWEALLRRADDPATAVVELGPTGQRRVSFAELERDVRDLAAGLAEAGMRTGDRVALLVPPGIDLTTALYACWRIGAVVVVADAGLGVTALGRALRGADPRWLIGISKALGAAAVLRIPGRRVAVGTSSRRTLRLLGAEFTLDRLTTRGRGLPLPAAPGDDAESAVLFTSGATGPAKGVVYRLGQLRAQVALISTMCGLTGDDTLVAAFAPFALYGPALGVGAAVPDMDVTAPGTLTAQALAEAAGAVSATVVFASPAALRNVVATADQLTEGQRAALAHVRMVLSFGAPVPVSLLRSVRTVLTGAELHTPYGMTEVLPVADISLEQIEAAGQGDGVCVGWPLPGVRLQVSPMTSAGRAEGEPTVTPGVTGEVLVAADHVKDRYDRLWATERASSRTQGWHRTGDVGHLDEAGRLWVEGRLVHVLTTPEGPLTPVGPEQRVESLPEVAAAAVVGVGPVGTQQVVVVVVPSAPAPSPALRSLSPSKGVLSPALRALSPALRALSPALRALSPALRALSLSKGTGSGPLADWALTEAVRAAAGVPVAAVLTVDALPVDIRHASKVDRARVGRWAARVLAGEKAGRP